MDFSRRWTAFAADAEVEDFGTHRIVQHYNGTYARLCKLEAEVERLREDNDALRRYIVQHKWDDVPDKSQFEAILRDVEPEP